MATRAYAEHAPLPRIRERLAAWPPGAARRWRSPEHDPLIGRVTRELATYRPEGARTNGGPDVEACLTIAADVGMLHALPAADAGALARSLGPIGDTRALSLLLALVRHHDPAVRRAVIGELLAGPHAPDAVIARLPKEVFDYTLRVAPFVAKDHGAGAPMLAALFREVSPREMSLQVLYLQTIAQLGGPAEAHVLVGALDSAYDGVQAAALDGLAAIGALTDIPALEPLTKGVFREADVKARARAAIVAILTRDGDSTGGLALVEPDAEGRVSLSGAPPKG
jgi:hypothetical protein